MKKNILIAFLVITGMALILYPFISSFIDGFGKAQFIADYKNYINTLTNDQKEEKIENAKRYNEDLGKDIHIDVSLEEKEEKDIMKYSKIFDIGEAIGYINVPKIDINLPIYHGTTKKILKDGVGHLESSSLPVGGKGTHAVLAGHTGLAKGKIFDNIDKLEIGDSFYITVLDKKMEYKVDNKIIVEPNDIDAIKINPDKDYVTLVTCTPKFINSHRLLVRGERVEKKEKAEKEETIHDIETENVIPTAESQNMEEHKENKRFTEKLDKKAGIIIGIILILISIFILSHKYIKD